MGETRGNSAMIAIMLLFCMFVFHSEIADAETYIVGDAAGWSLHVSTWSNDKHFKDGDEFVFKYDPKVYKVVKVKPEDFGSCNLDGPIAVYTSGNDTITLHTGLHFFISSNRDDCYRRGMSLPLQIS
ncbi:hypothetical protein Lal_00032040 [Lupinus albus]|uniref:Putative cupredoxin n=1 Tax=Lupinus albus TaxID=3870 RepID=A0A6A5LZA1_LUPAL|nr:putative cupredoxin [Lupinus albus]KAF1864720.1 hypothetical protein Lal_00032040 [Lupinus albus]